MNRYSILMAGAALTVAAVSTANAALIATDSFAGATVNTGGSGWVTDWTTGGAFTATGLTHPNVTSSGVAVTTAPNGPFRRVIALPNDGVIYNSFLLKSSMTNPATGNYTNLTFFKNYNTELFGTGVVWNGSGSAPNYGTYLSGSKSFVGGSTPVDGDTHLIVQVIDMTANTVSVYLDPNLAGGVLPGTASWSFSTPALDNVNLVRLEFATGNMIDEVRIGTTLEDVVVVPEPASLGLLGVAGLGLLARRR